MRIRQRVKVCIAAAALLLGPVAVLAGTAPDALAAACSTSTGATSCTINTTVTVTAGTLTLESSPSLYWNFVLNGYDQWASGSAAALSGCSATSTGTTCTGGSAPSLLVLDSRGGTAGWALSAYLTGTLPTGASFHFGGAGSSTIGNSQVSPIATDPFASTTPSNVCDYASGCTVATAASSCSHSAIGFTTCPTYPVNLKSGTSSTAQVDMYSANTSTGLGAICFASGTATAQGCTGTTAADFYNMGIGSNTTAGTYSTTVINLTVSSGP